MTSELENLEAQAARLYPNSPSMQDKWVTAVNSVRSTKRGWIFDQVSAATLREQRRTVEAAQAAMMATPRFADRVVTPLKGGRRGRR